MTTTMADNTTLGSPRVIRKPSVRKAKAYLSRPAAPLEWEIVGQTSSAREDSAVCVIERDESESSLVVLGGRSADAPSPLSLVEIYDTTKREWSALPSLSVDRCGCSATYFKEQIYVFGGIGAKNERLTTCESYDMDTKQWTPLPSMASSRWYCASVGLPLHGDIVVLGGRDHQWQELASVEAYDTKAQEWHALASMSTPRFGCGAARISASKVIAVGGFNGEAWLNTAEVYDYAMDKWTTARSMPGVLEFCTATPLGNNHVLVSGKGGSKGTTKFYVYNIPQDTWATVKPGYRFDGSATVAAIGSQVVVVDQTKTTFVATNVPALLEDDLTESTSQSSTTASYSSPRKHRHSSNRSVLVAAVASDDASTPWWTSAASASCRNISTCQPKDVEIPAGDADDADQVSVLAEDDISASGQESMSSHVSGTTRSGGQIRRRASVHTIDTVDSFGRKVQYTGNVSKTHNRPHGKGRMLWVESGDIYTGTFRHGRLDGSGQIQYGNGDSFVGTFKKDIRCGPGLLRFKKDGRCYDGNYENDLPHDSNGTLTWKNGTIYIGAFVQGQRTGKGVQRFPTGVRYQGDFVAGKYHGFGVCEFADGSLYKGHWLRGQAHGQGRLTKVNGEVVHDGLWERDGPVVYEGEE